MIILYWKDAMEIEDCTFNIPVLGIFTLTEADGKLYAEGILEPIINDASLFGWFAVPEQPLSPEEYEEDEFGNMNPLPRTINELNLTHFTADTLPKSQHIAKLKAVNPSAVRPATVTRRFMGELYDVDCFVTQGVKDEYTAGDIIIGDFVVVSYTRTGDDSETLPIVSGKVFESW